MKAEENLELEVEPNAGWDPRIRVAKCGALVRSYLLKTDNFLLIYDTLLGPKSGQWLRQQALDFAEGRPLLVVNSHADWDHYFGNMCFPEPILGSTQCYRRITQGVGEKERRMKLKEHPQDYADLKLVAPSILVEQATLQGGDLSVQVLATLGHRPDHLALYIPEINTLLPGDCVEDPIPLVDEDSQPGDQTLEQLCTSLQTMLDLNPSWVLANHAAPESGTGRMEANLAYLRSLQRQTQTASSLEELQESHPPSSEWDEFYQKAHRNQLRMAWEQRGTLPASK